MIRLLAATRFLLLGAFLAFVGVQAVHHHEALSPRAPHCLVCKAVQQSAALQPPELSPSDPLTLPLAPAVPVAYASIFVRVAHGLSPPVR